MFSLKPGTLVPIAAACVFIGLAALVASGHSFAIDSKLIMLFRQAGDPSLPLGPPWLREAMRDLTALGSFTGLGFMLVTAALVLWKCEHRPLALGLIVTIVSGVLASTALKILIGRNRPDIVEHAALTFTASFPSGHAFLSSVTLLSIAGFVGLAAKRDDITRLCVILAWVMIVLIGVSRIYLGVHWPTDVVAGWCLGTAWSSLAVALLGRRMAAAEARQEQHKAS
jgi:undecaprenyl-diphosphatase